MRLLESLVGYGGKVLGQIQPTPVSTWVNLYTVPAGKAAQAATLSICNIGVSSALIRLVVRPAAAALAVKHYQLYDATVDPGKTLLFTELGWTLGAGDLVDAYTSFVGPSFTLYGVEGA